jgi:hypothetical protein
MEDRMSKEFYYLGKIKINKMAVIAWLCCLPLLALGKVAIIILVWLSLILWAICILRWNPMLEDTRNWNERVDKMRAENPDGKLNIKQAIDLLKEMKPL